MMLDWEEYLRQLKTTTDEIGKLSPRCTATRSLPRRPSVAVSLSLSLAS